MLKLLTGTILAWTMITAAHAQCSVNTINGAYAFTVHGQSLSPDGSSGTGFIDGVGIIDFDGAGNLSQEDFVVKNGSEVPGGQPNASGFHTEETGTYTISQDCTGTAEINFGQGTARSLALIISKRGQAIHAVVSAATASGSPAVLQVYSDFEKIFGRNDN